MERALAERVDAGAGLVRVSVPKMNVGETSSTALALVFHELATNSAKYGALSRSSGTLDVSCNAHEYEVMVMWTERGGPPVVAPTKLEGFGSKLGMSRVSVEFLKRSALPTLSR